MTTHPPGRLRIVLADDAALIREGIARLLTEAGLEVVGQAASAAELLACVNTSQPDVAVVDIRMPPTFTLDPPMVGVEWLPSDEVGSLGSRARVCA
jgi:DNA-binding NarL/FixJ family response regulator